MTALSDGEQGNAPIHFAVGGRSVGLGDSNLLALQALIAAKCDLDVTNVSKCIVLYAICF
jgi:hypothetical protein